MKVGSDMKNPYIIPAAMICAAILAGFWMLKPTSEQPQKVIVVQRPDISIHKAAGEGNIEAVKQHLAAGTDVNAKGDYKNTPLHEVAGRGHNKDIAELLIAKGADVNAKDDNGWTPLHHAVPDGHKEIAELLITKGGNVNAKGIYGTPLDHAEAEWEGDVDEVNAARNEVAELLRKHGGKTGEELKAEVK